MTIISLKYAFVIYIVNYYIKVILVLKGLFNSFSNQLLSAVMKLITLLHMKPDNLIYTMSFINALTATLLHFPIPIINIIKNNGTAWFHSV